MRARRLDLCPSLIVDAKSMKLTVNSQLLLEKLRRPGDTSPLNARLFLKQPGKLNSELFEDQCQFGRKKIVKAAYTFFLPAVCLLWIADSVGTFLLFASDSIDLPSKRKVVKRISFQEGVDKYSGTVDTEIWALAPTTLLESNPNASSDANNDGGESQVLIRFDGIIGPSPTQIPKNARIVSARMLVSAFDQGSTVNLHRMLVPFPKSATWSSVVDGVSADNFEAARHKDSFTFGKIAANSSTIVFDVTDTVQAWATGQANHGWVFLNTGGNGWDFYTSEFENIEQRPKLVVEFEPVTTK